MLLGRRGAQQVQLERGRSYLAMSLAAAIIARPVHGFNAGAPHGEGSIVSTSAAHQLVGAPTLRKLQPVCPAVSDFEADCEIDFEE